VKYWEQENFLEAKEHTTVWRFEAKKKNGGCQVQAGQLKRKLKAEIKTLEEKPILEKQRRKRRIC